MFNKRTITAACGVLVSLAMATGAVAAGDRDHIARGRTDQGRKIRFEVHPHTVRIQSFSIELHCSGGYILIDEESNFLPSAVSGNGRIHDAQVGSTDEILLRGQLRGRTAKGRIRVRDRLGKHRCSSPWVRFTAHVQGKG